MKTTDKLEYNQAMAQMNTLVTSVQDHEEKGFVWFLEHEPVITVSARTGKDEIYQPTLPIVSTNRGGKATYHGPGQRVIYCILPIKYFQNDVRHYIRCLETWIIESLKLLGIHTFRDNLGVGIWYQDYDAKKKIAAIGVRISRGVTSHGIAINVNPDMTGFEQIVPCGIQGAGVTALQAINENLRMQDLDEALLQTFPAVFHFTMKAVQEN